MSNRSRRSGRLSYVEKNDWMYIAHKYDISVWCEVEKRTVEFQRERERERERGSEELPPHQLGGLGERCKFPLGATCYSLVNLTLSSKYAL